MENILTALKETATMFLANPATQLETILTAVLPLVVGVIVLGKLGRAMDAKEEGPVRSIIVMATGVAVAVLGMTASSLYVEPRVSLELARWMGPIVAVALSLIITVPVCLLALKQTYVSAAITTALMALILAAMVYLTSFSYEQITGAGKTGGDIGNRTRDMEQVIEGN